MAKGLRLYSAFLFAALVIVILNGCRPKDYSRLPALSNNNLFQAVIEMPAGSSMKVDYCQMSHRFRVEIEDGKETRVPYLPIPLNFGFIPSTRVGNVEEQGRLMDVMVLAERLETGTVVEVIPLGLLAIKDDFHTDYKVLAIPANPMKRLMDVNTLNELEENYQGLTGILESWLLNSGLYKNPIILGWENEHTAKSFINKWLIE